ncbi:hypothetical protein SAMN06295909_0116 [Plantibacter sp. VKM Ac-1784]|uniref:Uncharacterized protein n=1 Tax=Plantibacter elymi (nom. nud.) TaxID=199708 RepID=A0ABY1RAE6_9MICO|nr:hypothetical protein SAMN06295909_0116 [Plantibacter sp. VKM Ac-1784]
MALIFEHYGPRSLGIALCAFVLLFRLAALHASREREASERTRQRTNCGDESGYNF